MCIFLEKLKNNDNLLKITSIFFTKFSLIIIPNNQQHQKRERVFTNISWHWIKKRNIKSLKGLSSLLLYHKTQKKKEEGRASHCIMAHYKSLQNGKKKCSQKISSHINCLLIFCFFIFIFAACRVPTEFMEWK